MKHQFYADCVGVGWPIQAAAALLTHAIEIFRNLDPSAHKAEPAPLFRFWHVSAYSLHDRFSGFGNRKRIAVHKRA
jgi:hypothetical protein